MPDDLLLCDFRLKEARALEIQALFLLVAPHVAFTFNHLPVGIPRPRPHLPLAGQMCRP